MRDEDFIVEGTIQQLEEAWWEEIPVRGMVELRRFDVTVCREGSNSPHVMIEVSSSIDMMDRGLMSPTIYENPAVFSFTYTRDFYERAGLEIRQFSGMPFEMVCSETYVRRLVAYPWNPRPAGCDSFEVTLP